MSQQNVSRELRTPKARMSYANLVEPRPFMKDGKPKGEPTFNVELLFDADDVNGGFDLSVDGEWNSGTKLPHLLVEMVKEKWGSDFEVKEAIKHGGLHWPIVDGTERSEKKPKLAEVYDGKKCIRVKSKEDIPPRLFARENGKIRELSRNDQRDLPIIKDLFASGNYVVCTVNAVCTEMDKTKYLTFYVNSVLFIEKGERLGGRSGDDMFSGIEGGETDVDPTAGMSDNSDNTTDDLDDEIPF